MAESVENPSVTVPWALWWDAVRVGSPTEAVPTDKESLDKLQKVLEQTVEHFRLFALPGR